jgi:biopolymer transport protein ExbB
MWPLLALSILGLAIILEKAYEIFLVNKENAIFLSKIKDLKKNQGKTKETLLNLCVENKSFLARIFAVGLNKINSGKVAIKEAVEATGRQEIRTLERHIDWLATIAGAAPLLGFLGTVTGMVKAFQVIEKMGGPVNPSMLAAGIWEALITTVFGLSIAIPCVFAYNYFVNRIENIVLDVEAATNDLIDSFAND